MFRQVIEINNIESVESIVNNNSISVTDEIQEIVVLQSGVQGQRGLMGLQGPPGQNGTSFVDDFPDFNLIFENKLI